ncbi:hypothetical protein MTR67_014929 [Solanum verrucosum]|uniref:Uncharacterized protein n=1 Tax=Solanum verrucosum TaxID=315347 RepID=A0AAF0QKI4_SOLVR|nr:hypothetical protein MTR67_014929 [Solanum verrucosum]
MQQLTSMFVASREIQSWSVDTLTVTHDLKEGHLKVFPFSLDRCLLVSACREVCSLCISGLLCLDQRQAVPFSCDHYFQQPKAVGYIATH